MFIICIITGPWASQIGDTPPPPPHPSSLALARALLTLRLFQVKESGPGQ